MTIGHHYELLYEPGQVGQTTLWGIEEPAWPRRNRRRRFIEYTVALVALLFIAVRRLLVYSNAVEFTEPGSEEGAVTGDPPPASPYPWLNAPNSLNFDHSTALARENLRNDTYYITSFAQAGSTHLPGLPLGSCTHRSPIIPSAHVSVSAGVLPFGSIFNLTALRTALRFPILEWLDVKTLPPSASVLDILEPDDPTVEPFGCWSTKERTTNNPESTQPSENLLKLDLSFTHVPDFAFFGDRDGTEYWTTFFGLSAAILPGGYAHPDANPEKLPLMHKSRLGSELKPEERLACFDFLYYVTGGTRFFEYENKWNAAWYTVGRHLHFTDALKELSRGYLRRAFGLFAGQEVPPIITVHIRHGDFEQACKEGDEPPCHLPLVAYKEGVEQVQKELRQKHGVEVNHVLVASDETKPEFYDELRSYGWLYLNHTAEATLEKYGEWYPFLIDQVALSLGLGFVGTHHSTFSILSGARVEDRNGGVATMMDYFTWGV